MHMRSRLALISLTMVVLPGFSGGCGVMSLQKEVDWYKQQLSSSESDRHRLELELAQSEGSQKGWSDRTSDLRGELDRAEQELLALRAQQESRDLEPVDIQPVSGTFPGDPEDFAGIEGVQATRGENDEIRLTLDQQILFAAGSVSIRKSGAETLGRIADVIGRSYPGRELRVEGHTDNAPPEKVKALYPTNWELSTARACVVLRALIDTGKVDARRAAAIGYADQHPVAENTTDAGRHQNRRVEVIVRGR